jgi:hypothetical protein
MKNKDFYFTYIEKSMYREPEKEWCRYIQLIIDHNVMVSRRVKAEQKEDDVVIMGNTYTELLEAAGTIDHNNFRYINICNNIFSSQFGIAGWQLSKAEAKRLGQPHYSDFLK